MKIMMCVRSWGRGTSADVARAHERVLTVLKQTNLVTLNIF